MTSQAVQDAIKQAQATSNSTVTDLALKTDTGSQVAAYAPAKAYTLDDIEGTGFNVDGFITPTEDGMKFKMSDESLTKGKSLVEELEATIDMTTVAVFRCIKYGNPAVYVKTFDGVNAVGGGTWESAVRKANQAQPGVRDYQGADLSFVLTKDAVDVKGNVVLPAGTRLGRSTSTTEKANLKKFTDAVAAAGLSQSVVGVKITYEAKTNKNNQNWGILDFELLGEAAE